LSGVSDLQVVKISVFPLNFLVIVTTVLRRYHAACDCCRPNCDYLLLQVKS